MTYRKRFPPLPDFVEKDPKALKWRVDRLETEVEAIAFQAEEASRLSKSALPPLPTSLLAAFLWLCGLIGLVSPETAASVLKALGP
jgi:hypothetical protein